MPCRECQHRVIHDTIEIYYVLKPYHQKRHKGKLSWVWRIFGRGIRDEDWKLIWQLLLRINKQVESKVEEGHDTKTKTE